MFDHLSAPNDAANLNYIILFKPLLAHFFLFSNDVAKARQAWAFETQEI